VADAMSGIWAQPLAVQVPLASLSMFVLIGVIVWVIRWLDGTQEANPRLRLARLGVSNQASIDPARHLIVVRRDDVEHVLLIGGYNDLVVERTIVRDRPPERSDVDPLLQIARQALRSPPETLTEDPTDFPLQPGAVLPRSLRDILNSLPDDE
jgi:flagellar protein FliO/FliZ